MRLRKLHIHRMPGIDTPFAVEAKPGLNLIKGPNGSGKSTICQAVRHLLWPREESPTWLDLQSWWEDDGDELHATRQGLADTRWQRNGVDVPAPNLPQGHTARSYRLGLLDLVKKKADLDDAGLATRIRSLMAGGYDLDRVAGEQFQTSKRVAESEAKEVRSHSQRLRKLQSARRELERQEESLASLQGERESCLRARTRLTLWRRAAEVADSREALVCARAKVEAFPASLTHLKGDEDEELRQLEADLDQAAAARDRCHEAIAEAERFIKAADLQAGVLPQTELDTWRERIRELKDTHHKLVQAQGDKEAAAAARAEAQAALSSAWDAEGSPRLEPRAIAEIESLLRNFCTNAWQREVLENAREHLRREPPVGEPAETKAAVNALEGWLAAGTPGWQRRWIAPLILFNTLFIVGLEMVLSGQTLGWFALLAGLIAALAVLWFGRMHSAARNGPMSRAGYAGNFRATHLTEPEAWKRAAVLARLNQLRRELAAAETYQAAEAFRQFLKVEADHLQSKAETLAEARQELVQMVRADPKTGAAELMAFIQRVHAYQQAQETFHSAVARRENLSTLFAKDLHAATTYLTGHGCDEVGDVHAAEASLNDLAQRSSRLAEAERTREREARNLTGLMTRLDDIARRHLDLFARAAVDPDDPQELSRLLALRDGYREAVDQQEFLARSLHEQLAALRIQEGFHEHPEAEEFTPAAIDRLIETDNEVADRTDQVRDEITRIEERIRQARRSGDVTEAMSDLEKSRTALLQKREESLLRAAGRFMLNRVKENHAERSQPAVLARARSLFETFTHHTYRLDVRPAAGEAVFGAYDMITERGLALSELSDGTRAQLLLAARLAFVCESEAVGSVTGDSPPRLRPPIFLDESLTSSDPERFQAIAGSLLTIIQKENRQLFYLTANPADVQAWQYALREAHLEPVTPVDLGTVRCLATASAGPALADPALPPLPAPAGQSATEYATLLGVPPLDPRKPASSAHLFHLLRDNLPLLHRLLDLRIESVGQWRGFARAAVAGHELAAEQADLLMARAETLQFFNEVWRRGRGQPVDRQVLHESGAVSDKFLPAVQDLAVRLHGDGAVLLAALREGKVKGFYQKKVDELHDYLTAAGYLDSRLIHTEDEVRREVLRGVEPHLKSGLLEMAGVTGLVHQWWAGTGAATQEGGAP